METKHLNQRQLASRSDLSEATLEQRRTEGMAGCLANNRSHDEILIYIY